MKNNFSLAITTLLFVVGVSCTEKEYRFQLADDPGYVEEPVVAVRALDGDRWIEGNLDKETRTVTFKFHTVASLEDIALDVQLAEDWAQMTSPKTSRFEANLKNGYKFTVNDGVDDISYVINASMFQHIEDCGSKLCRGKDFPHPFRGLVLGILRFRIPPVRPQWSGHRT